MADYREILKRYWGYDNFRGIQEEIVRSVGEGRDTLGLMPTGGGKSVAFQVPALARPGLCLVVTPLIALMKDQVQNLRKRGIKAAAVYSGMTREEIVVALENCIFGDYKFLYISPERLSTEIFRVKLRKGACADCYGYSRSGERHPDVSEVPRGECAADEFRAEEPGLCGAPCGG